MQPIRNQETIAERLPEARYAYYRRCQVWRGNGEQCKAPAERDGHICYAHARQNAMQERRKGERRAVLEEAARRMKLDPTLRREREGSGTQDFCAEDMFTDFNGIQVTLAVVMQAIIDGRIDDKTAGRMLWELQIAAKLLWLQQRAVARRTHRQGVTASGEQDHFCVPRGAAEQVLQPHAMDMNDRSEQAGSASGWRLVVEARPKSGILPSDEKWLDAASPYEKAA